MFVYYLIAKLVVYPNNDIRVDVFVIMVDHELLSVELIT